MRVKLLFLHNIKYNTNLKIFSPKKSKKYLFPKHSLPLPHPSYFALFRPNSIQLPYPFPGNLNKYLYNLLSNFPKPSDEAALTTWLSKIRKTIQDFKTHYISEKEMFAQRLGQCLCGSNSLKVHSLVVEVYELVF
jgi:hypothetical protein